MGRTMCLNSLFRNMEPPIGSSSCILGGVFSPVRSLLPARLRLVASACSFLSLWLIPLVYFVCVPLLPFINE